MELRCRFLQAARGISRRLLKTASGKEGEPAQETVYSYDPPAGNAAGNCYFGCKAISSLSLADET